MKIPQFKKIGELKAWAWDNGYGFAIDAARKIMPIGAPPGNSTKDFNETFVEWWNQGTNVSVKNSVPAAVLINAVRNEVEKE